MANYLVLVKFHPQNSFAMAVTVIVTQINRGSYKLLTAGFAPITMLVRPIFGSSTLLL
jgi:hypothetical protein